MNDLSRRRVLGTAGVLTGVAALGLSAVTPTAAAAPLHTDGTATTWRGPRSANNWRILDRTQIHPIEGSGRSVRLASGEAATLLLHVARRFHYEIDQLRADDVTGHRTSRTVRRPTSRTISRERRSRSDRTPTRWARGEGCTRTSWSWCGTS